MKKTKELTIKHLTIKEKILISLEEPNRKPGRMVGGFTSILFATSIISRIK